MKAAKSFNRIRCEHLHEAKNEIATAVNIKAAIKNIPFISRITTAHADIPPIAPPAIMRGTVSFFPATTDAIYNDRISTVKFIKK
jgi:hypothetical protein